MRTKFRVALFFLPVLALAVAALPACADTTYNYTGNHYTSISGVYSTSSFMSGDFTVASPLGDSLSDDNISSDLVSWELNDGYFTWNTTDAYISTFDISTNSTGAIDGWSIGIVGSSSFTYGEVIAHVGSSSSSGDSLEDWYTYDYPTYPLWVAGNSDPGDWSGPPTVTPEPASGLDLALGLLALGALAFGKRHLRLRRQTASA
jgi:hypothetical protein